MTAAVALPLPEAPSLIAFERSPGLIRFAGTIPGRVMLLLVYGAMLQPASAHWLAILAATAALTFTPRRHAATITALATLAVFLLEPDWYHDFAPALIAKRAGLEDWFTPALRWGAPCLLLGFTALFLAAVRAGRPRVIARHPLLCLIAALLALFAAAIVGPGDATIKIWVWSIASALSGYMWIIALVASEQRNSQSRVPFLLQFGTMHPFWGSPATPYTVAPNKLNKMAAPDGDALAALQLRGLKLLLWADALVVISAAYAFVAHKYFGIPTFHEALARYLGDGLPWHLRWLCLFSDFFEYIIRLAAAGHVIIAAAHMAGYNLPRNTQNPLGSRNLAEFWGRYYYYFKELMLNLFYFPTYLSCFRAYPKLRAAFATFMAAGVGNLLFHFLRELDKIADIGFVKAAVGMQTYAFYCLVLSIGIAVSQLRAQHRRPPSSHLRDRVAPFVTVMGFFCLLHIFDDTGRTILLIDHLSFFFSLFAPFS